ncbi:MAG: 5-formyltetrahydrofolate cyclo-ligase [Clostridia bacterium]|nr:5-formyltetrahydrofolate cyclo-ligase [Clostridia bacterium]
MKYCSNKVEIRKTVLEKRLRLTADEVKEKSLLITSRLTQLGCYSSSRLLMCYLDFKNEVMTDAFINLCFRDNKKVAVPFMEKSDSGRSFLVASRIKDMNKDLESGTYGILEPRKDKIRIVDPKDIDLVIVPGVAFDICRNRIGYGAGYYDRFLPVLRSDCLKIGVAFETQIVEKIETACDDIPMDMIITEKRSI